MTPDAARAALAGALQQELGDTAADATARILRQLHREGWHITPNLSDTDTPRSPR